MTNVLTARNPSEAAGDILQHMDFDKDMFRNMKTTEPEMYQTMRQVWLSDLLHQYVSEVVLSTGAYFSLGKDKSIHLNLYAAMDMEDSNDEMYGKQIASLKSMFNTYIDDGHVERDIFVSYLRKLANDLDVSY